MCNPITLKVGDKFKVDSEARRYTVQAASARFAILTKPFAARKTYLYSIVDIQQGWRGRCNLVFGLPCDVNTPADAAEALAMLECGDMGVSCRRHADLTSNEIAQLTGQARDYESRPDR
jgi:hypothetical protein